MDEYFDDLLDSIDACVFTGDKLHNKENLKRFEEYVQRWQRLIIEYKKEMENEYKCPYCNTKGFIPNVCYQHALRYGAGIKHYRCSFCNKVVSSYFIVKVDVTNIVKSDRKMGDWG